MFRDHLGVLEAGAKSFMLNISGHWECVTLDRLKLAHLVAGKVVQPTKVPRQGLPLAKTPDVFPLAVSSGGSGCCVADT